FGEFGRCLRPGSPQAPDLRSNSRDDPRHLPWARLILCHGFTLTCCLDNFKGDDPTSPYAPPVHGSVKSMHTVELPEIMTAAETATYLRVPVSYLYQWRHLGTGPKAARVGRALRYRRSEVDRWLDAGGSVPQPAS